MVCQDGRAVNRSGWSPGTHAPCCAGTYSSAAALMRILGLLPSLHTAATVHADSGLGPGPGSSRFSSRTAAHGRITQIDPW